MITHKYYKYRVYPTKSTVARLDRWNSALKWLWNLANEQRRNGYGRPKGERIYPTAYDQGRELTLLRKIAPWIKDVPRHLAVKVLDNLDKAWQRCFSGELGTPKWKKKSDYLSFTEFDHVQFKIQGDCLDFPKLPFTHIVMHRPLEGKPKSCTLKRDGDQWFACIMCEVETPVPIPRTEPRVGIDRGITNIIADSDRRLVVNPKFFEASSKQLARAQRAVSRRVNGSKNREKASKKVMKLHRKIRRQRDHFLHVETTRYAKSHGTIVVEELKVKNLVKGRLARQIHDAGWSTLVNYLDYKLKWTGG